MEDNKSMMHKYMSAHSHPQTRLLDLSNEDKQMYDLIKHFGKILTKFGN